MTRPADLTLLVLRLAQGPPKPPVRAWFFFPGFANASEASARALLEACSKPVLVAPLLDAGCVGLWPLSSMEPAARAQAQSRLASQRQQFEQMLAALWPDGVDGVRLQEGTADCFIDIESFREWTRDYFITVGNSLDRDRDPRVARLLLRPPGGKQRPIGLPPDEESPRAAS